MPQIRCLSLLKRYMFQDLERNMMQTGAHMLYGGQTFHQTWNITLFSFMVYWGIVNLKLIISYLLVFYFQHGFYVWLRTLPWTYLCFLQICTQNSAWTHAFVMHGTEDQLVRQCWKYVYNDYVINYTRFCYYQQCCFDKISIAMVLLLIYS